MTISATPNYSAYYIYDISKVYYGKHLGKSHRFLHSTLDPAKYYLRCPKRDSYSALTSLRASTSADKHVLLNLLHTYHPEFFI